VTVVQTRHVRGRGGTTADGLGTVQQKTKHFLPSRIEAVTRSQSLACTEYMYIIQRGDPRCEQHPPAETSMVLPVIRNQGASD
jgi:hypothetical protein